LIYEAFQQLSINHPRAVLAISHQFLEQIKLPDPCQILLIENPFPAFSGDKLVVIEMVIHQTSNLCENIEPHLHIFVEVIELHF
jgi:hypothetical protein